MDVFGRVDDAATLLASTVADLQLAVMVVMVMHYARSLTHSLTDYQLPVTRSPLHSGTQCSAESEHLLLLHLAVSRSCLLLLLPLLSASICCRFNLLIMR